MRYLLPLVLVAVCFLSACKPEEKQQSNSQLAIYVVDTTRLYRESVPAKASMDFLNSIQTELQKTFAELQTKIQADPQNVEIQQEAQMVLTQLQQRMNAEEQNAMNLLNDVIGRVLDEYREKNKISFILSTETVHSYDKSLDITTKIMEILNKEKVEFKAIMPNVPIKPVIIPTPEKKEAPAATKEDAETQEKKEVTAPSTKPEDEAKKPAESKEEPKKEDSSESKADKAAE